MLYLNKPVMYLQRSDFNDQGDIINSFIQKNKPVIIMIQAGFCGHCTTSKPNFQIFADKNKDKYYIMTIQVDGDQLGEKELGTILKKIDPKFVGFPSYVVHYKGNKISHIGGRDVESLEKFSENIKNNL